MDFKSLRKTLEDNGIEEKKIAKIINDLEAKEDDVKEGEDEVEGEESDDEGKSEEEDDVPPSTEDVVVEEEVVPPAEEGAPNEEGELPPDGEVEPIPPVDEVSPTDAVPAAEEVPTDVPPVPPTPEVDFAALLSKIEELSATNEGLIKRVESLESALADSGVLEKGNDEEEIGYGNQEVPNSGSNGASDPFDDALAQLNGRRRY